MFFVHPHRRNVNWFPYSQQDDKWSVLDGANNETHSSSWGPSVQMFSPTQIPIKHTLAKSFGVFNRRALFVCAAAIPFQHSAAMPSAGNPSELRVPAWVSTEFYLFATMHVRSRRRYFTSVPSGSNPNHLFAQSATSCGVHENILWSNCGGSTDTFPQLTIFDNLAIHNVSFGIFLNSTCGVDGVPCHSIDPNSPAAASPLPFPDVAMEGVGRYKGHFFSQKRFYQQAGAGTLPALSWLIPSREACDHPCYDVAKGERQLKDVYEAVRAGPGWNKTMLLVVYDDAGNLYDHVVPPFQHVPRDDAKCNLIRSPTQR